MDRNYTAGFWEHAWEHDVRLYLYTNTAHRPSQIIWMLSNYFTRILITVVCTVRTVQYTTY